MEYLRSRSDIADRVQLGHWLMVARQFDNAQSPHSLIELTWQRRGRRGACEGGAAVLALAKSCQATGNWLRQRLPAPNCIYANLID